MVILRLLDEVFRGYAAPVETDATGGVHFDDGHCQPQLGGANRRDVAARARADNGDIKCRFGHVLLPQGLCFVLCAGLEVIAEQSALDAQ